MITNNKKSQYGSKRLPPRSHNDLCQTFILAQRFGKKNGNKSVSQPGLIKESLYLYKLLIRISIYYCWYIFHCYCYNFLVNQKFTQYANNNDSVCHLKKIICDQVWDLIFIFSGFVTHFNYVQSSKNKTFLSRMVIIRCYFSIGPRRDYTYLSKRIK